MPETIPVVLQSFPAKNVLMLTLSRPKARNAVTGQMISELVSILDRASKDEAVKAIVVTGDPQGRAFCAGADLNVMGGEVPESSDAKKQIESLATFRDGGGLSSLAALRCTKPIIAAINGAAVGWGLAFPLAADFRIAAEDAKCGFPMASRGLVNESLSSILLPRLVGPGYAKELVYTGRIFKAKDAVPGLFNYILPAEKVVAKAVEIGKEIASNSSTLSVALCKTLMDSGWNSTPEAAFLHESKCLYFVQRVKTEDVKEGIASFLEKRQPEW
eukprot:CAMPEP_0184014222 /NCGR_PEP_ID=MMETSP0954-20121128/5508_1 /TAXON_ID=627963 /ORGANISM="Aplanochytrium sp, Strain PBS07" /LENGTH=272 /DNA_ID=CAMNT_0026294617 /DNA_START=6 /DNA_END=821 /DNA_ORIENTATION=-